MCSIKSPKPRNDPADEKDPIYMRNIFLDGLGIGAESRGRNSLRIDRGSPAAQAPIPGTRPSFPPIARPPGGVGGGGDGRGIGGGNGPFMGRVLGIAR